MKESDQVKEIFLETLQKHGNRIDLTVRTLERRFKIKNIVIAFYELVKEKKIKNNEYIAYMAQIQVNHKINV